MASIRREPTRPRKPWRVDWIESGRRKTQRFATEAAARQWMSAVASAGAAAQARTRLDDWLEVWMATHGPSWSARTLDDRAYLAERLIAPGMLGRKKIGEITRPDVRAWRAQMQRQGVPAKVANDAVRALRAALGRAVDDDILVGNPCANIKPLPEPHTERIPVTLDQVEAIRLEVPTARDRALISVLAYTGARPAEARALIVRDRRPKSLRIMRAEDGSTGRTKSTKTGDSGQRPVPLLGPVADDLDALALDDLPPDTPIFRPRIDWDNWAARIWRPARAAAEADGLPPYSLRHTYASLLITKGRTVFEVARLLGHSTPQLTMKTYGHLFDEAQLEDDQDMQAAIVAARERAPQRKAARDNLRQRLIDAIHDDPAQTTDRLADRTSIDPDVAGRHLAYLQSQRMIAEIETAPSGRWELTARGKWHHRHRRFSLTDSASAR